ncbi:MAG: leucine-rich repeat domain-containing protein [Candidatus Cloacimonetes bacterium]|nr:leucine-rich repeat domain-containing protein [Candidatus Cloacimonadota bacterium]
MKKIGLILLTAFYVSIDGVLFYRENTSLLLMQYPSGKRDEIYTAPDGVVTIAFSAFKDNSHIVSAHLPRSLNVIGSLAFADCQSLTSISFGGDIEHTGIDAFESTNLTKLMIGSDPEYQGEDKGTYLLIDGDWVKHD